VPVVYAVCYIGGLLYLCKQHSGADGMNHPCGNEEGITGSDRGDIYYLIQSLRGKPLQILLLRDLLPETGIYHRAGLRVNYIPHLSLAPGVVSLLRKPVVRMNLYREPVVRINDLDEQRELCAVPVVNRFTQQLVHVNLGYLLQGVALKVTVGNH